MLKRMVMLLFVGMGVGVVASMWFGPGMIAWWFRPPGMQTGLAQMCGDQVLAATEQLVRLQLIAGAGLGVVMAIIGAIVASKKAKAEPTVPPASPPPTTI